MEVVDVRVIERRPATIASSDVERQGQGRALLILMEMGRTCPS